MARITTGDVSNFDESKELSSLQQKGQPVHWPPVHRVSATEPDQHGPAEPVRRKDEASDEDFDEEGGEDPSAGTNFLTSESKLGTSGSTPQEMQVSLRSLAPGAESLSRQDQQASRASSTAPLTSGSGQETGSDPVRQPGSSEELQGLIPLTRVSPSEEDPASGGFTVSGPIE